MILAIAVLLVQGLVSAVLLRNRRDFKSIHSLIGEYDYKYKPKVSILIPARNEEKVIRKVVTSALNQSYYPFEVIILNDKSEDKTGEILAELVSEYGEQLRVYQGTERPEGWLGKPWACYQLAGYANGEIFLFVDADTHLDKTHVKHIVADFGKNGEGLTTVWPQQILGSTAEKLIIPLVYYTLLGFLVTVYTRRDPRWMPTSFARMFRSMFAAACGQCIAMTRSTYEQIGGHKRVKSDVVEDVAIARAVRGMGLPVRMYHGNDSIQCRMYSNHHEIYMGFRKNFLAGFGDHLPLFISSALLHITVFVLPIVFFVLSLKSQDMFLTGLWFTAIIIPIAQRLLLNNWFKWPIWTAITHVFGVLWFQFLGLIVVFDRLFKRKVLWKGRPLS